MLSFRFVEIQSSEQGGWDLQLCWRSGCAAEAVVQQQNREEGACHLETQTTVDIGAARTYWWIRIHRYSKSCSCARALRDQDLP